MGPPPATLGAITRVLGVFRRGTCPGTAFLASRCLSFVQPWFRLTARRRHVPLRATPSVRFLSPSTLAETGCCNRAVPRPRDPAFAPLRERTLSARAGFFRPLRASSRSLPGLFHPGSALGVPALQRSVRTSGRTPFGLPCPSFPWPRTCVQRVSSVGRCRFPGFRGDAARAGQPRELLALRFRVAPSAEEAVDQMGSRPTRTAPEGALGSKDFKHGRARVVPETAVRRPSELAPLLGFAPFRDSMATLRRISPATPLTPLAVPHRPTPEPQGLDRSSP